MKKSPVLGLFFLVFLRPDPVKYCFAVKALPLLIFVLNEPEVRFTKRVPVILRSIVMKNK